jgi:drug/metabolite transporter (DMT)-like permease
MNPSPPQNKPLPLGVAFVVVGLCIAFGANAVAIKICLTEMGSFTLAAIRFAVAAVLVSAWALLTGKRFALRPGQLRQVLVLAVVFTCQIGLFYLGLTRTAASRGTLIANLQPFLVLVLAHFFVAGDRITARKALGIAFGFVGVAIMFLSDEGVSAAIRTGDLIVLGAVVLWGGSTVYTKRIIADYEPYQLAVFPMYLMAPVLLVAGFLWDEPMIGNLNLQVIGALAYQCLVTASFGFVLWNTFAKRYGIVALHSFIFVVPISGVALGGLILGEPVGTVGVLGALALIVLGILVVNLGKRQTASAATPPEGRP